MKLELGSGKNPDPDYDVHLDIDVAQNPAVVADALSLPFADGSFDGVKVVDVLEHISYRDTTEALNEWNRVMVPGGRIYIQVPEAAAAIRMWQRHRLVQQPDLPPLPMVNLAWILMGGQFDGDYIQDKSSWRFNSHYALFDVPTLKWYLRETGFVVETCDVNPHPNILCWARKIS